MYCTIRTAKRKTTCCKSSLREMGGRCARLVRGRKIYIYIYMYIYIYIYRERERERERRERKGSE